eukprot:XP_001696791.1 predicted protein [Chlamydomonas reinhardtii]
MPSQRRHEVVSTVYTAILTILVLGTANASAVRPITSGSSDSRPGDVLPLCYQLNDALSIALAGDLSSLAVLRRHLQLEQFHARRQLELELLNYEQDVTVDEDSGRDGVVDGDSDAQSEERAQELARHGEQRRQHAQAAAALTSQFRSKLQQQEAAASQAGASTSGDTNKHNSNAKINSTDSGGAATATQIAAAAAAAAARLPDLRFLPQCLISRLDPSLFTSPDLPQPQLPTITSLHPAAASHLHHLGHAAQQPHTDTATTGPYFNRPWMLPVLAAPFRRCSSLHAATTPPNATSFSSDEEAINRTRHLGFGIEMLINVDSRKDAAAVAEFAAGPLGAGDFVVPVYSNNVHEIRSYNRLARLARGKILVMLQDDDVFPEESACMWLSSVVRAFARWPRLGAVGSQRYVFNYHPNTTDWYVHYWDAGAGHHQQELLPPSPQQQDRAAGADPAAEADPDQGPPPYEPPYIPLESYDGRLRLQFVSIIDYAPIAVSITGSELDYDQRAGIWELGVLGKRCLARPGLIAGKYDYLGHDSHATLGKMVGIVGGIDENMSESGACGVHSDYDLTLRMWMAGWQVAYVEVPGLGKDPAESEGGTHRRGVSGYCWERQWDQAIGYMRTRWGQHNRWDPTSYYWFGSNLLQPLAQPPDSYCPFGYGCGLKPVDNITGTPQQRAGQCGFGSTSLSPGVSLFSKELLTTTPQPRTTDTVGFRMSGSVPVKRRRPTLTRM